VTATTTGFDFDAHYRATDDPWHFADSPYEQLRYRSMLDALSRPRYRLAFEPGCSIGVFTRLLAARCEAILATDVSPTALEAARARCQRYPQVSFAHANLADARRFMPFDLVVLSELGYYFSASALRFLIRRLMMAAAPEFELLMIHWRGTSQDHLLSADQAHQCARRVLRITPRWSRRTTHYRLDSWIVSR
jgi:SAM-dependent methyltransferase